MISEGTFKIFYSHSRDLYGIPDPFGKCVLVHVDVKSSLLNTFPEHDNHGINHS